jgi:hypothetical protein
MDVLGAHSGLIGESPLTSGRKRLSQLAQRLCLQDTDAFLTASLASAILGADVTAKAPLHLKSRLRAGAIAAPQVVSKKFAGAVDAGVHLGSTSGFGSRKLQPKLSSSVLDASSLHDVSTDEVSVSLHEWRVPMRAYSWGCGSEGQLGCGTVAGKPAFKKASRPLLVNFAFADMGAGMGDAADEHDRANIAPVRVVCGEGCTAFIDNLRRLFTCGTGWLGQPRGSRLERIRLPTLVASLSAVPIRGEGQAQTILRSIISFS